MFTFAGVMMANLITSLPMLVCFFWVVLLLLDALGVLVAERSHLDAGDHREDVHRAGTAHAKADYADPELLDRLVRPAHHRPARRKPESLAHAARRRGGDAHPGRSLEEVPARLVHVSRLLSIDGDSITLLDWVCKACDLPE